LIKKREILNYKEVEILINQAYCNSDCNMLLIPSPVFQLKKAFRHLIITVRCINE